jgi:hypothetical protein
MKRRLAYFAILIAALVAAQWCADAFAQPATQPTAATANVPGRIGSNLSYLKPQSGRILINAGAQGEVPVLKPAGLQWQVLIGPKGSRLYDGDYTVLADEPFAFSVVNSPAKITAPGVATLAVPRDDVSPQLHLLFPGRTELPKGIRVLRPGCSDQQAREQVYTAEFIDLLRRMRTGTVRAMDWQRINGNTSVRWADRCTPADALWGVKGRGGPIEPVIDLCNALGADLWVCVPHGADDDYVRQLVTLIKARLRPGLRVIVEYSNEVWNTDPGFTQTAWVKQQALAAGIPYRRWYAKRLSEIATIGRDVFSDQPGRLVIVMAGQTGDSSVLRESLAFNFKPDAVATGGYFNAPAAATTADEVFAGFAANARGVYAGTQIAKFNALADSGPYRKMIYEWTGVVDNPTLAQATRDDARWAGVMLAAGAGIFGNGFEAACNFVPLSDSESKYGATDEAGRWTAKAAAIADLSGAHPSGDDPRIAGLEQENTLLHDNAARMTVDRAKAHQQALDLAETLK